MSMDLLPPKTPLPPPLRRTKINAGSPDGKLRTAAGEAQLTYSSESVFLQHHDPASGETESTSSADSERVYANHKFPVMGAEYDRPSHGSIVSMDRLLNHTDSFSRSMEQVYSSSGVHVQSSISPSMQLKARQMVMSEESEFHFPSSQQRERRLSQASPSLEFPEETDFETESSGPRIFSGSPRCDKELGRTFSMEVNVPSMSAKTCYQPPSTQDSIPASIRSMREDMRPGVRTCVHKQDDLHRELHSGSQFSNAPEGLNTPDKERASRQWATRLAAHNEHNLQTSALDGRYLKHSEQTPRVISSENTQASVSPPQDAVPDPQVPQAVDEEGELGLDSLRSSKAEQIDTMFHDRNDQSDTDESVWLWIFFKIFSWTVLMLTAAFMLICAKVSTVALSQLMLTSVNISRLQHIANISQEAGPAIFLGPTQSKLVSNKRVIIHEIHNVHVNSTLLNTTGTFPSTSLNDSTTLLPSTAPPSSTSSILAASLNTLAATSATAPPTSQAEPVLDLFHLSMSLALPTLSPCELNYLALFDTAPSLADSFVYSSSKGVYIDMTVLVMWVVLLLVPAIIGLLMAVYSFIRWQTVRRASLSWKAILTTILASLVEVAGTCVFLFEVLPLVQGCWAMLLPSLFMVFPSMARLYDNTKAYRACIKMAVGIFVLLPYLLAMAIVYLIISKEAVFGTDRFYWRLLWTLPLAVLPVSAVWTPMMLTQQVDGTYSPSAVDNLDGNSRIEDLEENKLSGLRVKQKMLGALCRLVSYPLMVFVVVVLFEGYATFQAIQDHLLVLSLAHIIHHPAFAYFVLNLVSTILCPAALWVVFTAAIELKLNLRGRLERPVSGSFFVLVISVLGMLCFSVSDIPCRWVLPGSCCSPVAASQLALTVTLVVLLVLGNLPVIYNVMIANHAITMPIYKVFTLATTNPVLTDPWVWLNISSSSLHQRAKVPDFRDMRSKSKIYICTTMYREDQNEMMALLRSIKRINDNRGPSKPLYEAHVFFDGAISLNDKDHMVFNGYALQLIALVEKTFETELSRFGQKSTPYGIQWKVPLWSNSSNKPMMFYIHLKDNNKVKQKKRWSQIMYMVWAIEHEAEVPVEDRYVLITDGDTKFYEKGPIALLDALLISPEAAAVVGRVRPIVTCSPLVWYQVFEYAASFWIYKASNDQLGTDLCCSGCFTMYRGSMLKEVMKDYAIDVVNAQDFLMIDMGEDLWLSTLLIRCGYKLKYCSVADVFTQAPSKLEEYYKQRRRWYLSSLAYFFFFIHELPRFKFANPNVTLLYLFYQGLLLCFPLISTSTLGMVLAIAQSHALMIPLTWSCIMVAVIFGVQLLICLCFKSSIQIKASALLSIIPSLSIGGVVVVVLINVCNDYIDAFTPVNGTTIAAARIAMMESPLPLPTVMLTILIGFVVCTGLLHPKEFYYLIYVIVYIIGAPLGYIFLRSYILCNITDQSWGTRESNMASQTEPTPTSAAQNLKDSCSTLTLTCCHRDRNRKQTVPDIATGDARDPGINSGNTSQACDDQLSSSISTSVSTVSSGISGQSEPEIETGLPESEVDKLIAEMETMELSNQVKERMLMLRSALDMHTRVYTQATDKEDRFWERMIELKLSNVETPAHKRSHLTVQEGLRRFQNRMLVLYLIVNILWIGTVILFWQFFGESINTYSWGKNFNMIVIVAVPYLFFNLLQFVAMFIHRMGIWLYLLARTKCRIGDVITCGYPTATPATPKSDVIDPSSNWDEEPRTKVKRDHGGQGFHKGMSPSPITKRKQAVSSEAHDRGLMTGWLPSPIADAGSVARCSNLTSSQFQNSRWLLGNADRGLLMRGVATRGMMELALPNDSVGRLAKTSGREPQEAPPVEDSRGTSDAWQYNRHLVTGADTTNAQNHYRHVARNGDTNWGNSEEHASPAVITLPTPSPAAFRGPLFLPRVSPQSPPRYRVVSYSGSHPVLPHTSRMADSATPAANQ